MAIESTDAGPGNNQKGDAQRADSPAPPITKGRILDKLREDIGKHSEEYNFGTFQKGDLDVAKAKARILDKLREDIGKHPEDYNFASYTKTDIKTDTET
jgi:hypothetical protein